MPVNNRPLHLLILSVLFAAACDDEPTDGSAPRGTDVVVPEGWVPTSQPFSLPQGADEAETHEFDVEDNPNLIERIALDDGELRFIDRAAALGQEDGGIAVLATGAASARVAELMDGNDATALEIYLSFEDLPPPDRLWQDHASVAAMSDTVPEAPRALGTPEVFRDYTIYNAECPNSFSYSYWRSGWESWSSGYGNQISCTSVEQNIDILTWSSSKRAIGACYNDCDGCSSDGATITFYGWTGSSWLYLDGPVSFQGGATYGQAVYWGVSGFQTGQDKGAVRSVEANEEVIYVGARSQISGGQDEC